MKQKIEQEIWKDIPNYEGYYQASNFGRIRSIERIIIQNKGGTYYRRIMPGHIIKPRLLNSGYDFVALCKHGVSEALTIHRLVARTFFGDIGKLQVNHIDGNKQNNAVSNLELVTQSENIKHSYAKLGHKRQTKAVKCVNNGVVYPSIAEASRALGVNDICIGRCLRGKYQTAGGYQWERPNKK